ncbi:MAG: hypothetical protein ACFE89_04880 [Candidatus Hodarchaeota archaeon]
MNPVIGVIIIILVMAIIEIWDFRAVPVLLAILGTILTTESLLEGIVLDIVPFTIFFIGFMPVSLYFTTIRTKIIEEPSLLTRVPSMVLLITLVIIAFVISFFILGVTSIQWPVILIGLYGLLSKTDLRKTTVSVSILTYSVHLLVPAFDIVIEGLLLVFSGGLILVLLLFAQRIFSLKGSLSTKDLRELQY